MAPAKRQRGEHERVIAQRDVVRDKKNGTGNLCHVLAATDGQARHEMRDRQDDRVEEQEASHFGYGPAWPSRIWILRGRSLVDFAAQKSLYVADGGCGGERCFVERDLVTILERAEEFDTAERVEL